MKLYALSKSGKDEIEMKIATVLFTYNRSAHTKKTIDALHNSTILPEKLFIFHDGLKCEEHREEWINVRKVINTIDWCNVEIIEEKRNKGLARNIVDGITKVMLEYDAVIVLEDDCVAHPLFMEYATKCLNKWVDNKKVFCINGYSENVDIEANGTDAYFLGRPESWGWATWRDRWAFYEEDYKMLVNMKRDSEINHQLNIWGQDLEGYLLHNIDGRCNSWAVFWALQCIKRGGYCLTPYYSLIENIGLDGTGVHCGKTQRKTLLRERANLNKLILPDIVEFPENYEEAYEDFFKWVNPEVKLKCYNEILIRWNMLLCRGISVVNYFKMYNISNIAIWGRGNLCKALLYELEGQVKVNYIIESNPTNKVYGNIPIIAPCDITDEIQSIVVIPVYDMNNIRKKVKGHSRDIMIGLNELLEQLSIND